MLTVKVDGVRLGLGKTRGLPPIPWPGAKALCERTRAQPPSMTTWSSLGQSLPQFREMNRDNSLEHRPRGNIYTAWKEVAQQHDNCQKEEEIETLSQFYLLVTHSGQ